MRIGGGNSSPAAPKATPKKRKAGTEDDKETPSRKKATPKGRAKKGRPTTSVAVTATICLPIWMSSVSTSDLVLLV
jgi:hypothetical protein